MIIIKQKGSKKMDVSVVGLGYIGLPTAITLALHGHKVKGFDVSKDVVKKLNEGHIHIVEEGLQPLFEKVLNDQNFCAYDTLQASDVYIISVPTPFKDDDNEKIADLSYVENAARLVASKLKPGDLVILESTVPPMTTAKMTDLLVEESGISRKEFFTAHCPERVLPGNIMYEMEHNDRIIGAESQEAAQMAKKLYESFLTEGQVFMTDDVTAEMCKLVENSYRDVNIAFANELSIICDKLKIKVEELIELANKHPRVNILSPGVGVGGHCLAVDPYFIVGEFKEDARLIDTARAVNTWKPYYISNRLEERLKENNQNTVTILGLSYKPDIDDFRESPSIILAKDLQSKGFNVKGCDPNTDKRMIEGIPMVSMDEALDESGVLVLTQRHKAFLERADELQAAKCIYI